MPLIFDAQNRPTCCGAVLQPRMPNRVCLYCFAHYSYRAVRDEIAERKRPHSAPSAQRSEAVSTIGNGVSRTVTNAISGASAGALVGGIVGGVPVRVMARAEGYAMVRKKGAMPFVVSEKELSPAVPALKGGE